MSVAASGGTITWDGDITGLPSAYDMLYKISDICPTVEEISAGGTLERTIVSADGTSQLMPEVIFPSDGYQIDAGNGSWAISGVLGVLESAEGMEVGLWFCVTRNEDGSFFYPSSLTINDYTGFTPVELIDAFVVRRGGSSGKLFAAIGATYPAGSTCTCTNGSKTLKAKTTSGQCVFPVPEAGTWIVTATDGTSSKSETVEITAEGQIANVELSYWDGTIYDSGNEYEAYTGGWTVSGKQDYSYPVGDRSVGSKDDNKLYVGVGGSSVGAYVRTTNKIPLEGVSAIQATVTALNHESSWGGNERAVLQISDAEDMSTSVASIKATSDGAQILTLSVSTTGSYYVGLWVKAGTASSSNMTASKIQLIY